MPSKSNVDQTGTKPKASGYSSTWTRALLSIRRPINKALFAVTDRAARNPWITVISVIFLSFALVVVGIFTNFAVNSDEDTLWTPDSSRALSHGEWIQNEAGFPTLPRYFLFNVHSNGNNILGRDAVEGIFEALDTVRETPGYADLCEQSLDKDILDGDGKVTCPIYAPTRFWNHSTSAFREDANDIVATLSALTYSDGTPVDSLGNFGFAVRDDDGTIVSVESMKLIIAIPEVDDALDFEEKALENVLALKENWEENSSLTLTLAAERSFGDEFNEAIVRDIPLVPLVFVIMSIFTCMIFFKRDWVFSRSLLGFGAVVAVLLAIMSGYGLMFVIGVPFTSMTQILPFIMFGIGLDAAFIISGSFARSDKDKSTEARIHDTTEDIGISILVTTFTSVVAFSLGCTSSIPAVYQLCLYAAPTIFINFVYMMTFFVALIVIDERRVADKRRDCLVCFAVKSRRGSEEAEVEPESRADQLMGRYADFLMKKWVKAIVLLAFTVLLGACAYGASQLEQAFDSKDVLPKGSYLAEFWTASSDFTEGSGIFPGIYFRDVDQSDPAVQEAMQQYVEDVVALKQVTDRPTFFWLEDFKSFIDSGADGSNELSNMTFTEQMDAFLDIPVYREIHANNIVRDETGNVIESRCFMSMNNVDMENVNDQITAIKDQRAVGQKAPMNEGRSDWAFFTFDGVYYIWDFFRVTPIELTQTTILGVSTVTAIGTIFIPHWSAFFFVFPMIVILYVDLLGMLQFAGVSINSVSYIALVMSIGLLVDFLLHILLRYYESKETTREAKVKDMLQTMGSSILIGGISTFLGVIPLAFSTSEVFSTIFISFMALVTLGIGHGLIMLPVLLSMFGTTEVISMEEEEDVPITEGDDWEAGKVLENETAEDSSRSQEC